MTLDSKETVFFDEEVECAWVAMKEVLDMFKSLLTKMPETGKAALQRSMGAKDLTIEWQTRGSECSVFYFYVFNMRSKPMIHTSSKRKTLLEAWFVFPSEFTAAMRMLAYGVTADYVDEYVRIGESTAIESLKKFVKAVVAIFSDEYLRLPNNDDIARLLAVGENRGFPGMLGSIDCMQWKLKNCPTAWK
ncbi:hypothetical protein HHK36_011586 [Tetracentron sinense]|uniref:Uncharacterized protein n=1 Tax=Tetracentron sinense TaxID=13715 RepID=A0A834ZBD2_TETSI|nr:hypothetical protein HHK36_011586 [Tetracentron sinense]